jgi:hypothetical protein
MPVEGPRSDFYVYRNGQGILLSPWTKKAWAWAEEFLPTDRSVYGPRLLVDPKIWPAIRMALRTHKFKVRSINL